MDTFFEQIIPIRKDSKSLAAYLGIWVLAFALCSALVFFLFPILGGLNVLLISGIIYGAYRLSANFNIEYEYIITNGSFDIDKIINRSSRKRLLSFELSGVSRLEKYSEGILSSVDAKAVTFACEKNDPNAYLMVVEREGKSAIYLVFSPDERMQGAIKKFIPKYIANSAFK